MSNHYHLLVRTPTRICPWACGGSIPRHALRISTGSRRDNFVGTTRSSSNTVLAELIEHDPLYFVAVARGVHSDATHRAGKPPSAGLLRLGVEAACAAHRSGFGAAVLDLVMFSRTSRQNLESARTMDALSLQNSSAGLAPLSLLVLDWGHCPVQPRKRSREQLHEQRAGRPTTFRSRPPSGVPGSLPSPWIAAASWRSPLPTPSA